METTLSPTPELSRAFKLSLIRTIELGHWLVFALAALQAVLWTHYAPSYAPRVHSIALLQLSAVLFAACLAFVTAQHMSERFVISSQMNMERADSMITLFHTLLTASMAAGAHGIAPLPTWAVCVVWAVPILTLITAPGISYAFDRSLSSLSSPRLAVWGAALGLSAMVFGYQLSLLFGAGFGVAYVLVGMATTGFALWLGRTDDQRIHLVETVMHIAWNATVCIAVATHA